MESLLGLRCGSGGIYNLLDELLGRGVSELAGIKQRRQRQIVAYALEICFRKKILDVPKERET
jgi:hypothetical protein